MPPQWDTDSDRRMITAVFFLSAAVLAFELSLMRILLISGWHHFAFVVISVALLGFGAAGVLLYVMRPRLLPYGRQGVFWLTVATAIAMPLCATLAQRVPLAGQLVPAVLVPQISRWFFYWLIVLIPFLSAGAAIGLALMLAGNRVARMYAGNLAGSAVGAVAGTVLLWLLPPEWLPAATGAIAAAAALFAPGVRPRVRYAAVAAVLLMAGVFYRGVPADIRPDPYKYSAYVRQLQAQNLARRVARRYSPQADISVYQSDLFHDMAFLSGELTPPALHMIVIDGHAAAGVLTVNTVEQARVVQQTLSAAVYELAPRRPRVLLLDELGGSNIWLAVGNAARLIDVVHPYGHIAQILRTELRDSGGVVLTLPGVSYYNAHSRHFIEHTTTTYDVIQLVGLESIPSGGGIAGLRQDYLLTREGIEAALRRLSTDGILVASRGIQEPPRDNLRLMALFSAALRRRGVEHTGDHIVIVRDFLAVCTMVKPTPWRPEQLQAVVDMVQRRNVTGVWFAGIPAHLRNQPDQLSGPAGSTDDWYYYAAQRLFSADAADFIRQWLFDISPPTDNRPYFYNFSRLSTVPRLRALFGELWLIRTELSLIVVVAIIAGVGVLALLLTLVPLIVVRPDVDATALSVTAGYFFCLGLAYLMIEMTMLARLTRLIGDPVLAAATTIAAFLFFSGWGSLWFARVDWGPAAVRRLLVAIAGVVSCSLFCMDHVSAAVSGLPLAIRMLIAALYVAPSAWLMGMPLPAGLRRLQPARAALVAWAWGVNGFASVLAAPVATLIAMTGGFFHVAALAVTLYVLAGFLFARLTDASLAGSAMISGSG